VLYRTDYSARVIPSSISSRRYNSDTHSRFSPSCSIHRLAMVKQARDGVSKDPHYEWMGPPGALMIMVSLPIIVYALYFACNETGCITLTRGGSDFLFFQSVQQQRHTQH
jgi:hypothetical protein